MKTKLMIYTYYVCRCLQTGSIVY